jgi:hypothetical protein
VLPQTASVELVAAAKKIFDSIGGQTQAWEAHPRMEFSSSQRENCRFNTSLRGRKSVHHHNQGFNMRTFFYK